MLPSHLLWNKIRQAQQHRTFLEELFMFCMRQLRTDLPPSHLPTVRNCKNSRMSWTLEMCCMKIIRYPMAVETASSDSCTQRNVTSCSLAMTAGSKHIPETMLGLGPAAGTHPVPGTAPCYKLQLGPSAETRHTHTHTHTLTCTCTLDVA